MRKSGLGWVLAAGGLLAMASPACASKKSGLMLAVTTDMKAPKDVNAVGVTISTNNVVKYSTVGRVTPDGDILLPATLAIAEPDDPNATLRIRVVAFQEQKARVLRDVRTSIPPGGKVSLLRIPLSFINEGSVTAQLSADALPAKKNGTSTGGQTGAGNSDPAQVLLFAPNCPNPEHTWVNGDCVDPFVDFNSLPEFREDLVGAGEKKDKCFDVAKCFATATSIEAPAVGEAPLCGTTTCSAGQTCVEGRCLNSAPATPSGEDGAPVDAGRAGGNLWPQDLLPRTVTLDRASCSVKLTTESPAQLNLALVTPDTGECIRPGECFVPLDSGDGGWKAEGGQIKLPSFVCRLLGDQKKGLRLYASQGCAAKTEANPVCVDAVGSAASGPDATVERPADGGLRNDAGSVAGGALLVPEDRPSGLAFSDPSTLVMAGASRTVYVAVATAAPTVSDFPSVPAFTATAPWVDRVNGGVVITDGTTTGYARRGGGATATLGTSGPTLFAAVDFDASLYFGTSSGLGKGTSQPLGAASMFNQKFDGGAPTPLSPGPAISALIPGSLPGTLVFGTTTGQVRLCQLVAGNVVCGVVNSVGSGRVDGFATWAGAGASVYAIVGDQVYLGTATGPDGTISVTRLTTDTSPKASGLNLVQYFRRGLAASESCVYYANDTGLSYITHGGAKSGTVATAPAGGHVLAVALGGAPRTAGSQPAVY